MPDSRVEAGVFQSTLPVRGATTIGIPACFQCVISIHAPRAGSDPQKLVYHRLLSYFNPRSPCGERQVLQSALKLTESISIHAPRAGSDVKIGTICSKRLISIHAPRAGSDAGYYPFRICPFISIHAPRAGSDRLAGRKQRTTKRFQSTLPVRGATRKPTSRRRRRVKFQSTLPVRGATAGGFGGSSADGDFNPRSPCGERPS